MKISSTPILVAIELAFLFTLAWRAARHDPSGRSMRAVYAYLSLLTAYALAAALVGAHGVYTSVEFMRTLPGLWLPSLAVVLAVLPIVLLDSVREPMRRIVDVTPWHWFAHFHALRISALGAAYKTAIGEFPAYFEYAVGIPDLLFGVSALCIASKARRREISGRAFAIWNLIGALIIVPATPILLQLGLPGPFQVFTSLPDARAVFTHPMSIAPVIGVPLFVCVNLWVAWRLWERRNEWP